MCRGGGGSVGGGSQSRRWTCWFVFGVQRWLLWQTNVGWFKCDISVLLREMSVAFGSDMFAAFDLLLAGVGGRG